MEAVILLLALYFLPTIIAVWTQHFNATAIGVLNLLLGWTLIGWVVALVWAVTNSRAPVVIVQGGSPVAEQEERPAPRAQPVQRAPIDPAEAERARESNARWTAWTVTAFVLMCAGLFIVEVIARRG